MGAAKLALIDAKLNIKNEDPERIGLVIGIANSGMDFAEKQFTNYRLNGLRGVSTLLRLQYFVALQLANFNRLEA